MDDDSGSNDWYTDGDDSESSFEDDNSNLDTEPDSEESCSNWDSENEEPADEAYQKTDDNGSFSSKTSDQTNLDQLRDLRVLFDDHRLKEISSGLDPVKKDISEKRMGALSTLLSGSTNAAITLEEWCSDLAQRKVDESDAIEAFEIYDTEGNGTADPELMKEAISNCWDRGNLTYCTKVLQSCLALPGFLDVFSKADGNRKSANTLLNFVKRNRADISAFSLPVLVNFYDNLELRHSALNHILKNVSKSNKNSSFLEGDLNHMEEIENPYRSVKVSSNHDGAYRLSDADTGTYWQSDGASKSHWIRIHMKPQILVKQLFIYVSAHDQSYMPAEIMVSAGKRQESLKEIKEIKPVSGFVGMLPILDNMTEYYPFIQINIRRCVSDGCDTRIHQIKLVGLRMVKEQKMSVSEASIKWFLQLITKTALHTMSTVPALKDLLVNQTTEMLKYLPPMSLTKASHDRPRFLTDRLSTDISSFLDELTGIEVDNFTDIGILCRLKYSLAACNTQTLIDILCQLLEAPSRKLQVDDLVPAVTQVIQRWWTKGAKKLNTSLVSCDSFEAKEDCGVHPKQVLDYHSTDPSQRRPASRSYRTLSGTRSSSLIIKCDNPVQVTRMFIKTERGDPGAKHGAVFLLSDSQMQRKSSDSVAETSAGSKQSYDHVFEGLKKYDSWTSTQYQTSMKEPTNEDGLIAYFTFQKDWDETIVTLERTVVGKNFMIKFLEPRSPSTDYISFTGVNFYGYPKKLYDMCHIEELSCADSKELQPSVISDLILSFLLSLIQSLVNKRSSNRRVVEYLHIDQLQISSLMKLFNLTNDLELTGVSVKVLILMDTMLSYWRSGKEDSNASQLFDLLCSIIDNQQYGAEILTWAQRAIVSGAQAFFPSDEARKQRLLKLLVEMNQADHESASCKLIFESLCIYFSDVDPSAFINLSTIVPKTKTRTDETQLQTDHQAEESWSKVMDSLLSVMLRKLKDQLLSDNQTLLVDNIYSSLLKLYSSLQTYFFSWLFECRTADENIKQRIVNIFMSYIRIVCSKYDTFLSFLLKQPASSTEQITSLFNDPKQPLIILQQLVTFTKHYITEDDCDLYKIVIDNFTGIIAHLRQFSTSLPKLFIQLESEANSNVRYDNVIETWTEESPHNYANNSHYTKTFYAPGANSYTIEFDNRCETERRFDYLEFTVPGKVSRFHGKIRTATWPSSAEFKCNKLEMLFHSDGSHNAWGYKFKVTAKGSPEVVFTQLFDLHLSLSDLIGHICGLMIAVPTPKYQIIQAKNPLDNQKSENKAVMLNSNLWKTLFRAGYVATEKFSRSFSGLYGTGLDASDKVKGFLLYLIDEPSDESAAKFIQHLQAHCVHYKQIGVDEINRSVISMFAALVWHTAELRENITTFVDKGFFTENLITGVQQAYDLAEHLRLPLVQLRQKSMGGGDDSSNFTFAKEMVAKSQLLFQFAPITKIYKQSDSKSSKNVKNRRTSAKSRLKDNTLFKQVEKHIPEKYGQFSLILEFIIEPSWTCELVEQTIKTRTTKAQALCQAYFTLNEYLDNSSELVSMDNIILLKGLLRNQRNFSLHYSDMVDGCGLGLENRLRRNFYTLIRTIISGLQTFTHHTDNDTTNEAYAVMQVCLMHLVDIDWRDFDLAFIKEIDLPKLFMEAAKENVALREKVTVPTNLEEELACWTRNQQWREIIDKSNSKSPHGWQTDLMGKDKGTKKEKKMFVAQHSDILDCDITCDGCNEGAMSSRYRCLDCDDIDLCVTCFTGGVSPSGNEHNDKHTFVYFVYKCDVCSAFIKGAREHCNVCEDFDLCYGCYKNCKTAGQHKADHEVTDILLTELKASYKSRPIASYLHQHAWLKFAQLTLSSSELVFDSRSSAHDEYQNAAIELLSQSLKLVTDCLDDAASLDSSGTEDVFVRHSQERIMGLLGAVFMHDEVVAETSLNTMLASVSFLKFIFFIASGNGSYSSTVQILALGLLARLMQKSTITPVMTDSAVLQMTRRPLTELKEHESGYITLSCLIQAAVTCLSKPHGIDWAYSLVRLLQQLLTSPAWETVIMKYMQQSFNRLKQDMGLELVICLYTFVTFPPIISPGMIITYKNKDGEERSGVVLQHFPDKQQSFVVDTITRKRHQAKDESVTSVSNDVNCVDPNVMKLIIDIIMQSTQKLNQDSTLSTIEQWILYLCLRVFNQHLQVVSSDFDNDVIKRLVSLAAMGTGVDKHWISSDLEVMSLTLHNRSELNGSSKFSETDQNVDNVLKCLDPERFAEKCSENSTAENLNVLKYMFNELPFNIISNIYRTYQYDSSSLIMNLHNAKTEYLESRDAQRSPPKTMNDKSSSERVIDFGITKLSDSQLPIVSSTDLQATAESEPPLKSICEAYLKPAETSETKKKEDSSKLLKSNLSRLSNESSPLQPILNKVNKALVVLHARQVLVTILAQWPNDAAYVDSQLFDQAHGNLALVLDILSRDSKEDMFQKVVEKMMSCCQEDCIQKIADSASIFMDTGKLEPVVRTKKESKHVKYEVLEGRINQPGASLLVVTFDKHCRLSDDDELIICDHKDPDKQNEKMEFRGIQCEWKEITIQGDSLYYRYTPSGRHKSSSKWKFTVDGVKAYSFSSGFTILTEIFKHKQYCRWLDIGKLWARIAVIACRQTGKNRLKALSLLMRILLTFQCSDSGLKFTQVDLSYLMPLWILYKNLKCETLTSDLVRSLTELFLIAEDVAMANRKESEFAALMLPTSAVQNVTTFGLKRVLAVSAAIDYDTGFFDHQR